MRSEESGMTSTVWVVRTGSMRSAGHVAHMGERKSAYVGFVRETRGRETNGKTL